MAIPNFIQGHRPRIAVSCGEPAGIGPDLVVQLAQADWPADLVAFADPDVLRARAACLNLPLEILYDCDTGGVQTHRRGAVQVQPFKLDAVCQPGRLNTANSRYVLRCLDAAVAACGAGEFDAVVTAPIHKGVINDAGIPFSGHTERLAEIVGGTPVMMLTAGSLRVALVTTHLPLAAVAPAITPARLRQTLYILNADLQFKFGITHPRIVVCGLNPHAGEGGHLGREEIEIIEPTLAELRAQGMHLIGPIPADTAFTQQALAGVDAVLAMFHDQGLPVLKHAGFGQAVNVTLGLPIIRTSVDHGTALDLAGTGKAEVGSLETALRLAIHLAQRR